MLKALKVAIYDNLNLRQNASPGREGKRIEEEKLDENLFDAQSHLGHANVFFC